MLTDNEVRLWNRTKDGEPYARKRARTVREGLRPVLSKLGVNQGDERQRQTRPLIT